MTGEKKIENNSNYGHRKMIVWQNLDRIEVMVLKDILKSIPKSKFSLIDQIERASSSCVANFIEGYYSGRIKEYIRFLEYSRRSLAELEDWVRRCFHRSYIPETAYLDFQDLSIKTTFLINRLIASLKLKDIKRPSSPS